MTDEQIERLVMDEIEKRSITFYDMAGLSNANIDPDPLDKRTLSHQRARRNRFKATSESERMEELLCIGEYNAYKSFQPLKVPIQDLFRFWWNRCIVRELLVEEILGEIFTYFKEQMRPPGKEEEHLDITIDFDQLPLSKSNFGMAA